MPSNEHRPTERVLDILELLSTNPGGMTLTELSRALHAPKSSLMPLVHTMASRRFLFMRGETSKYFIGIGAYCAGAAYSQNTNALELIREEMKRIVSAAGETCQLGIQNRGNLLYIAKEESGEPIRLISYVGKQLPLYCTAMGRTILAGIPEDEVRALYPEGLKAFTPNTITHWNRLFEELEQIRRQGYAVEREEATPLVNCAGVSLQSGKSVIAALSVSIPTFRLTPGKLESVIHLLKNAKSSLELSFQSSGVDMSGLG